MSVLNVPEVDEVPSPVVFPMADTAIYRIKAILEGFKKRLDDGGCRCSGLALNEFLSYH